MKGRILQYIFLLLTLTVALSYCAKQATPTGGPKDETPPEIVKSVPVSGITRFKSREIEITFNEYVTLDKLNEKLMISPPVKEKPEIYLRGKSLFIKFMEDLKDSTTYTLYFQDAIKDLNEGNPINNFQFVFATGSVIDSLSVTGNVLLSDNLEPGKNVLVTLYRELADSAPRKMLPDYITIADVTGGFRINNIREGKYRLFALVDNNNNKKYDLSDESFAFLDSIVEINHLKNYIPVPKDTVKIKPVVKPLKPGEKIIREIPFINGRHKLFLFTMAKKDRYLTSSSRKLAYQLIYTLSLPPDTMNFSFDIAATANKNWFIETNPARDTMVVWLRDSLLYSDPLLNTVVTYPFTDSTGSIISKQDSIPMRYSFPKIPKNKQARNSMKFSSNILLNMIGPHQKVFFVSTTPILAADTSKIRVYETDTKTKKSIPWILMKDTVNSRKFNLEATFVQGKKYLIILDARSFRNIYGDYSDSTGLPFSVRTPDSYGNLLLKIGNVPCKMIIQLLDNKEKIIAEKSINSAGNVEFPMLNKGFYRLRAIYDLNGDGKWTTGDYDRRIQPEPVSYLPKEVEIKENWNHEEEWDTGIMNFKDRKLGSKKDQL